jgi:hypothetical protein
VNKIRCGGSYCEVCKRCLSPPKLRKNYIDEWWTICEECEEDVLEIIFKPREESLNTRFKVKYEDIPYLISILLKADKARTKIQTKEEV